MLFHKATKSLSKELDPAGDLIPVRSVIDQHHFRPLCLVQRKRKQSWWQTRRFQKTEYKLSDVLLSGDHAAKLEVQGLGSITVVDHVDGKAEGNIGGRVEETRVEATAAVSMSHSRSVNVRKIYVHPQLLDSATRNGKINLEHEFIKQSKMIQRDLFVINEAVETVEETEFRESSNAEGNIFYDTFINLKLKGGRGSKKAIVIPKSCILAFRAKQLLFAERDACISHYPSKGRGTFDKMVRQCDSTDRKMISGIIREHKSKDIQQEVKEELVTFSSLSAMLCGKFLTGFLVIMRENDLLQELELQLEEALEGTSQFELKAGKPELRDLVENLQDSSGAIFADLVEAVLYFLYALDELTEEQLILLAESVEKKIVNSQLALVGSILDNDFSTRENVFTVEAKLLSEEELNITGAIIEMSGVAVQKSGPTLAGTGSPAAFSALCALYVALYALNTLST
ncbi:gasdermin-A [Lacerta agilis]|uniref:gasdermin-A n=1 Tax=Lacerta agilis TaxID=80427 RepID=UPI00141A1CF7|nr:gasdermin-A [Lacerta agilis]